MNILALDTATEACSVALYCSGNNEFMANESIDYTKVRHIFDVCPQQQSQQLLPMIDKLLSEAALTINNIDLLVYGRGPGSFTGVRIAASTVQGLALGADLPVVEVSTLAAMAQQTYEEHGFQSTCVLIDARMQEVYQGHYIIEDGIASLCGDEKVHSAQNAWQDLQLFSNNSTQNSIGLAGTGFNTYELIFADYLQKQQSRVDYPNAKYMLALGLSDLHRGAGVDASNINPVYVRDTVTWQKLPHKQ